MKDLIGVIHFPIDAYNYEIEKLEVWLIRNLEQYKTGGIHNVILQDQVLEKKASIETVARVSALCFIARKYFPEMKIGLILDSNDCEAAIRIALLNKLNFIRVKVFVGCMIKNTGIIEGCASHNYKLIQMAKEKLKIYVDIYDKTGTPLGDISYSDACKYALKMGASTLILTGCDIYESKRIISSVSKEIDAPIFIGGGVTIKNLKDIYNIASGFIVSSCLLKDGHSNEWSSEKVSEFVQTASML